MDDILLDDKNEVICSEHNLVCKFDPPTRQDHKRRKLIVTFVCPKGHSFEKEYDVK